MSNSATQFCSVLTGTMISTQRALVSRKKTSTREMTCSVLPSPILCARMQPRPLLILHRSSDSTTLSYRNRIPPIYEHTTIIISQTNNNRHFTNLHAHNNYHSTHIHQQLHYVSNLCSHSLDFPFSKTALNTDVTTGVNTGWLKSQEIYTIARLRTIYDALYKSTHHHHYHQYYNEESGSIKTGHYSINNTHATVHDTLKKSASKFVHMTKGVENN